MSDKSSPKPSGSKPAANKAAPSGVPPEIKKTPGSKPSSSSKPARPPEEPFDFLAPPQAPGELGRLANYRVLKVQGRGGMGTVFMAEEMRLHRIVALKVMLPSIAKKALARARFIREARATAAIEHDHIVTIYEVSNEDCPVPYLAMQFLKGMTLEDWLKAGGRVDIAQIMRIGREIASALAAAHACQLIHRDIKPSNIWLDAAKNGRVKIVDFGLARPTNEETRLTQEGMILGTPAYMSPEQSRGLDVDERCDLFSLGCVLYRLCAEKLPFIGKDVVTLLLAITSKEPAPLMLVKNDLPPALAELVHKLLAKKPENRPASAQLVVEAIEEIERVWIASPRAPATRPMPEADAAPAGHNETVTFERATEVDPGLRESALTDLSLEGAKIPPATQPPPRDNS